MLENILSRICRIPEELSLPGSKASMYSIVNSIDYKNIRSSIDEETLSLFIHSHIEVVQNWIYYSEDKRTSSGWFFTAIGNGWEVGRLMLDGNITAKGEYTSAANACAAFILRELDSVQFGETDAEIGFK
jgi:hypothetical protein